MGLIWTGFCRARDCGVDIMCLDSTMRIDQLAYPFENRVRSFMCYF